jgi:hypothetical protein
LLEVIVRPDDKKLLAEPGAYIVEGANVEFWLTHSFAPDWFTDAVREAGAQHGDLGARRREILFSVAFGETYIIEWVRDDVLKRDYQRFRNYFRAKDKLTAVTKWKEIPKRLYDDKLIPRQLDLEGKPFWDKWLILVSYRNGLVHAGSSRPDSTSLPEEERPLPPLDVLANLTPGWAIKTAVQLVKVLHETMATALPSWMTLPLGNR